MALKTIADLPGIISLNDNYTFVIDDGEHNYKITWGALKNLTGAVTAFTVDPDTENYPGYLKLTLANGDVLRVKPSDPDKQNKLTWDDAPTANSDNPVTSNGVKVALDAKQDTIKTDSLYLSDEWSGDGPYTQSISVNGATSKSKIDLQPDATVLSQLIADGVRALWVQNDDGDLTAYALGAVPSVALSIQYTRTEIGDE